MTVACCFSTTLPDQQIQAHPNIPVTYPSHCLPKMQWQSNPNSSHHPYIPSQTTQYPPAFTCPTFDAWCQQQAPLKKTISCRNKNAVVDALLRPTTTNTAQDKFHDTSTARDSDFERYPFSPQHMITTITLFILVLAVATRPYITILLPPTQQQIACTM